jgi:hypothetical protein
VGHRPGRAEPALGHHRIAPKQGSEEYVHQDEDLKILDEMIADLGRSSAAAACDLLLEHLQAARRYLLGSMPGEYSLCLQQARESLAFIPEKVAGTETKKSLRYLIDSEAPKQRRSTAASSGHPLPSPAPLASAS